MTERDFVIRKSIERIDSMLMWASLLTPDVREELTDISNKLEKVMADYSTSVYTAPTPSLCDSCKFANYIEGGSIGIGSNQYRQRYCSEILVNNRSIHTVGYLKCNYFKDKRK